MLILKNNYKEIIETNVLEKLCNFKNDHISVPLHSTNNYLKGYFIQNWVTIIALWQKNTLLVQNIGKHFSKEFLTEIMSENSYKINAIVTVPKFPMYKSILQKIPLNHVSFTSYHNHLHRIRIITKKIPFWHKTLVIILIRNFLPKSWVETTTKWMQLCRNSQYILEYVTKHTL